MLSAPILGGLPNSLSQTRQRRAMNAIGSPLHAHCRDRRGAVGGWTLYFYLFLLCISA